MFVQGFPFIALWIGQKYADQAETLIIIFFVTLYFYAPHLISYSLLQGLNKHKLYSYLSAVIAVLNLILSIILVQLYGLVGVAIGSAIPQILFFGILVPFYTCKIHDWSYLTYIFQTHIKLMIPTVLLYAGLTSVQHYIYPDSYLILFAESFSVALLYFIAVYVLSLSTYERGHVNALLSKLVPASAR
jgi:O-antigen/teichoic acid export membrane protein